MVGRVVTTEDKGIEAAIVARLTESRGTRSCAKRGRTPTDTYDCS